MRKITPQGVVSTGIIRGPSFIPGVAQNIKDEVHENIRRANQGLPPLPIQGPSIPTIPGVTPPPNTNLASIGGLGLGGVNAGQQGFAATQAGQKAFDLGQKEITNAGEQVGNIRPSVQNTIDRIKTQIGQRSGQEQTELGQLQSLQQRALDPTVDSSFGTEAERRRQEIEKRFALGGASQQQFGRDLANSLADLAASGQTSGTTAANALARLTTDFGSKRAEQLFAADELSRQQELDERQAIRGSAGQFGGIRSGLAGQQASLINDLIGREQAGTQQLAGLAELEGQLGIQRSSLGSGQFGQGANLTGTGFDALNKALGLGLETRGQEASLQLAQQQQREQARQGILDLLRRKDLDKQQKELLEAQLKAIEASTSSSSGIGGILGGIAGAFL